MAGFSVWCASVMGVSSFTFDPRTGEARERRRLCNTRQRIQGEDEALRLFDGKVMVPVGDNSVVFDPVANRWQALPQAIATNGTTTLEPRLAAVLNGTAFAFFATSHQPTSAAVAHGRFAVAMIQRQTPG
ncbi:MAG: hypothetical protein U0X75_00250 [Acidobacteriota bacterium]